MTHERLEFVVGLFVLGGLLCLGYLYIFSGIYSIFEQKPSAEYC